MSESGRVASSCATPPRYSWQTFDGPVVRRYDLLNHVLSLGLDGVWRRSAARELAPVAGKIYLDIGSGTGDMAIAVVSESPSAQVVQVDPSLAMLVAAREKLTASGPLGSGRILAADAADLPFPDSCFDGITCAFCLRNIVQRDRALQEMRRVLQPGGRVAILELTRPSNCVLRFFHRCYNRFWVPLVGRMLSSGRGGAAYTYLARSIQEFPSPEAVLEEMTAAGFVQTRAVPLHTGIVTLFSARAQLQG